MRLSQKLPLPLVASLVLVILAWSASSALAAEPWWHLTSGSRPGSLELEGKGKIVVTASNLGDGATSGEVKIVDKLPHGVKAVSITAYIGNNEPSLSTSPLSCSPVTLTCTTTEAMLPYSKIEVLIKVDVEAAPAAGEVNEVSISGGGAPGVSFRRPLAVSSEATPFGVESDELTPENVGGTLDTQAGSHPFQLTSTLALNQTAAAEPVSLAKDLNFILPPGLIGNPMPLPQCTIKQFLKFFFVAGGIAINECSPQTAIGVAEVTVNALALNGVVSFQMPLFNLEPAVGEPARFGFYVIAPAALTPVILDTAVRTGGDYGVTVTVNNIAQTAGFISSQVTFWGVPGSASHDAQRGWGCLDGARHVGNGELVAPCTPSETHNPPAFLSLPTSCTGPLQSSVDADSWAQEGVFSPAVPALVEPSLDGCNQLRFTPSLAVAPDGQEASKPSGLTVDQHIPQEVSLDAEGLSESNVRDVTATLPEGVTINPAGADGLEACSEAQVGYLPGSSEPPGNLHFTALSAKGSLAEPFCPNASKIGTARIKTPFLANPLEGTVYLAAQNANPFGSLVAMYLVAEEPISGVLVKLPGEVSLSESGRITATFENLPQAPFEDAELHFFGGERAPLATPPHCGSYTTNILFTPWSGDAPVNTTSAFPITSGPSHSACPGASLPFAPALTAGTVNNQAGSFSPFTMTMSREDGNQNLKSIELHMPPGLSGVLTGVPLCGEAQADAGSCPAASLIGETTVSVGLGGSPFTVRGGQVFLTGPYAGAPFGLSIVNPAVAGPFNLGKVVVRAKLEVNATTAAVTVTSDPSGPYAIPPSIDGIPLEIKHVNVTIDRAGGFTFNPTNCNPSAITGALQSIEGGAQTLSVPFQATNCAVLKFAPKFAVSTSGKTSRANGASLAVKLTYPNAPFGSQANIARVKVDLPKQLPSRLTTLQKACTAAQFNANPAGCPAASFIGHARAVTPLIPVPLEGPAIFVSHGGEAFPSLIIVLQGYNVTLDLVGSTFISKSGITSSTFKTVPDAPVGSFELTLPEGKYSALAANGNLCKSKLTMPTEFTAQNGATFNQKTKIGVTGCKKTKKAAKAKHKRAGRKRGKGRRK
jgi:hypothetical protein